MVGSRESRVNSRCVGSPGTGFGSTGTESRETGAGEPGAWYVGSREPEMTGGTASGSLPAGVGRLQPLSPAHHLSKVWSLQRVCRTGRAGCSVCQSGVVVGDRGTPIRGRLEPGDAGRGTRCLLLGRVVPCGVCCVCDVV